MFNRLAGIVFSVTGLVALLALTTGFVPMESEVLQPRSFTGELQANKDTSTPFSAHRPLLVVRDGSVMLRTLHGAVAVDELDSVTPLWRGEKLALDALFDDLPFTLEEEEEGEQPEELLLSVETVLDKPLDFQTLRWNGSEQAIELTPEAQEQTRKLLDVLRNLAGLTDFMRRSAEQYRPLVEKYAAQYHLDPELVYALIHIESRFDPCLISNRAAHGLMQVVPNTAGGEVHRWLGFKGIPSRAALLEPETNIQYGTAYMYLLQNRYLGGITDELSREYCAIASYNIGAARVLKTFGRTQEEAFAAINAMSPDMVRDTLLEKVPSGETRAFLAQVLEVRERFAFLG